MSTRNVAMVFAPNMTQALDPLTALKYAVQIMNFLNMLIEKTINQIKRSSHHHSASSVRASSPTYDHKLSDSSSSTA
ncbi:hypothetical protein PR202_gb03629 [Eleusine coracana subsp. coracana]|uniref:Rho-GAP domain-containing protein n=1 Tax=Eleusine coracana subsp. coracana TaxID=191504 RepID=A0AAV5E2J0_ELECO|nr:hypothetical protein PR202_gb03629 [Eleusine coracana subsp. coracana]